MANRQVWPSYVRPRSPYRLRSGFALSHWAGCPPERRVGAQGFSGLLPEHEIAHLHDAQRFYGSAVEHFRRSAVASGAVVALAGSLLFWSARRLKQVRGQYSSVRFTRIPDGIRLFRNRATDTDQTADEN